MVWCKKSLGWWTLSGILLGLGFLMPPFWVAGVVGGGIFIWRSLEDESKLAFVGGWWAWTIKYMCANSHIPTTYPIEWLAVEVSAGTQILLIGLYWITMGLWLGFGGLVVVGALRLYRKYFQNLSILWVLPLLLPVWVLGEVIGSLFFSIMTYGPGGTVNMSYSVGYSGYLLGEHGSLLQVARWVGVYGLSGVFAFIAFLIFLYKDQRKKVFTLLFLLFASGFVYQPTPPPLTVDTYTVAIVDTYFDRSLFLTKEGSVVIRQRLNQAVDTALKENPDYLILPEGANYLQHEKPLAEAVLQFRKNYPETKTILIDSGTANYDGKLVVEAAVIDPIREKSGVVHKRYLVPQGEFMPVMYTSALRFFGSESMVDYVKNRIALTIGPRTNQGLLDNRAPGILLCFESVSPLGVRTILNEKPIVPFIAHPISHLWFHEPVIWWHDVDVVLRVQALWNRVYIVSAGNYAAGKTYAPNGSIVPMDSVTKGEGWEIKQVQLVR